MTTQEKMKITDQSIPVIKQLLETSGKPFDTQNSTSTPAFWSYRPPLTISLLVTEHGGVIQKKTPYLKKLIDHHSKLLVTRHLQNIYKLVCVISDRLYCGLTRKEADSLSIREFIRNPAFKEPYIERWTQEYIEAWNVMIDSDPGNLAHKKENISVDSSASYLFYDQHTRRDTIIGLAPCYVIQFLCNINNSLAEGRPAINLSSVTSSNIVSLASADDLLQIILSHSDYSLSDTERLDIEYDWVSIENDVKSRYLYSASRVTFKNDEIPYFTFKEDFNMYSQIKTLATRQKPMSDKEEKEIIDRLNERVSVLNDFLKQLQDVINFLTALPSIDMDRELVEYMKATLGYEHKYLTSSIKLKHVTSLWLLIKFQQTHQLMTNHQTPFDDVVAECCETMSEGVTKSVNESTTFDSPKTLMLLKKLFEFITVKLNKDGYRHNPVDLNKRLQEAIWEYLYEYYEDQQEEITDLMAGLADDVLVRHAVKVWCHMWNRYTTQLISLR